MRDATYTRLTYKFIWTRLTALFNHSLHTCSVCVCVCVYVYVSLRANESDETFLKL